MKTGSASDNENMQRSVHRRKFLLKPQIIVVIDTEEEFDWQKAFSREKIGGSHMKLLAGARKRRKTSVRPLILGNIFDLYPSGVNKRT